MNISNKIEKLFNTFGESVEIGKFLFVFSKGWIHITDNKSDKTWSVMYTTHKDFHNRGAGPSYIIDGISKETGDIINFRSSNTGVFKSAISMWPVDDKNEAELIFEKMKIFISEAYTYNFKE